LEGRTEGKSAREGDTKREKERRRERRYDDNGHEMRNPMAAIYGRRRMRRAEGGAVISEIHISQSQQRPKTQDPRPKKRNKGKRKKGNAEEGKWSIKERKTENKEKEGRAKTDQSMDPRGEGRSNRS
jgi:hypothetical protein